MSKVVVMGTLKATPEGYEQFVELMKKHAQASREEPGCLRFDLIVPDDGEHAVQIYEIYEDAEALKYHQNTDRMKAHGQATRPLTAERSITFGRLVDSADL